MVRFGAVTVAKDGVGSLAETPGAPALLETPQRPGVGRTSSWCLQRGCEAWGQPVRRPPYGNCRAWPSSSPEHPSWPLNPGYGVTAPFVL